MNPKSTAILKQFGEDLQIIKDLINKYQDFNGFFLLASFTKADGSIVHLSSVSVSDPADMIGRVEIAKQELITQARAEMNESSDPLASDDVQSEINDLMAKLMDSKKDGTNH